MTKEIYLNNTQSFIYSRMYGNKYINISERDGSITKKLDKIIKINKDQLEVFNGGLFHQWGFPGPDWFTLKWEDYGETWAFNLNELEGELFK